VILRKITTTEKHYDAAEKFSGKIVREALFEYDETANHPYTTVVRNCPPFDTSKGPYNDPFTTYQIVCGGIGEATDVCGSLL